MILLLVLLVFVLVAIEVLRGVPMTTALLHLLVGIIVVLLVAALLNAAGIDTSTANLRT